jgi:hypothetical protein
MRAAWAVTAALLIACGAAAPAHADPAAPTDQQPAPAPVSTREFPKLQRAPLDHTMQFGIALMPGSGFRGIFPYQDQSFCGTTTADSPPQPSRVCTGRIPFFMDTQISFGIATRWDLLVDLRFGIEKDFTQTHQFAVSPGFRYWVDPDLDTKFFTTLQGVLDTTNQQNPMVKNNDFGVRNANGFMYEVMRNLGFYVQFGETLAFRRWLRFEIDGGLGVQARFP